MIESIKYFSDKKSFKKLLSFKWMNNDSVIQTNFKSNLALKLLPQMAITSYKYNISESIYSLEPEDRKREEKIMKSLAKLTPEISIFDAPYFNNACFIPVPENASEEDLKEFCKEFGVDYNRFKKRKSNNVVFLGPKYTNAVTLAHELGHYLNTIGMGEKGGDKDHEKYSKAGESIQTLHSINNFLSNVPLFGASLIRAIMQVCMSLKAKSILNAEKKASITAIRLLRLAGIDETQLTPYMRDLQDAYDGYVLGYKLYPLKLLVFNIIGAGIGIGLKSIGV